MRFCVLLGSGVSRPASLPSVNDITSQMLVSEDFFRDSDEIYRRVSTVQPSTQLVQIQMPEMDRIKQFLRWFKGHAELRYAADNTRQVNYEDLAYLAAQIHDDAFNEYENPALGPLVCCVLNSIPDLCSSGKLGK